MTMHLLNGNGFNVPKWQIERWMLKWWKKTMPAYCWLCVGVMAAASYFFPEIANYLQMLQSATNIYRNRPVYIIGGNRF